MNTPRAWLPRAAKVLLEAGLLLVLPLIFSRGFTEQFTYPKKVLSESLIVVAAVAWCLTALWRNYSVGRLSACRLKWPLVMLVVAVLASCVNSPVPTFSLRESIYFLCGPVWALLLIAWVSDDKEREVGRLFALAALGGAVAAFIAVLQWSGHDPLIFGGYTVEWGSMVARMRLYSTFGNPNFVAGYLIATVFLGAALALHSSRLLVRLACAAATAVMLAAIVGTGSRGAWIGLGAGLLAAILVFRSGSRRPTTDGQATAAEFLEGETLRYGMVCLGFILPAWQGLLNIWFRHFEGRVFLWRAAWPMFTEHPILGSGWATLQLRFLEFQARYRAAHPEMVLHWTNTRQLHNDLWQFVLETGLIGLLAWVWLLWTYIKSLRRSQSPTAPAGLWLAASAGGVTAILVDSLFNFQFAIPPTFILMFTLLAVPEFLAGHGLPSGREIKTASPERARHVRWIVWRCAATLGVVVGGTILLLQIGRAAVADRALALGMQFASQGEVERAEEAFRRGIKADSLNGRLHFGLARVLYSSRRYSEALGEIPRAGHTFADSHLEVLKARIEDQMGLAGPALTDYRHALALDPTLKTVQPDIERLEEKEIHR